jgi:hypothetical protein
VLSILNYVETDGRMINECETFGVMTIDKEAEILEEKPPQVHFIH